MPAAQLANFGNMHFGSVAAHEQITDKDILALGDGPYFNSSQ